jgi:zinc transport system substrate-binding protein
MKKIMFLLIACLFVISGCSAQKQEKNKKVKVVTTFYPMYYFTKQITGDLADVQMLVPNGVEPHDWEPSTKDMMSIQDSDLFVYNSKYFEKWAVKALKSVDQKNMKVVEATNGIKLIGSNDPHVWLSPVLAKKEVDTIASALEKKDPKNKMQYAKNADNFKRKLDKLDVLFKETLSKRQKKEFVTQHAAFGYLAKQYGLTQIPIAGLSPDVEPTLGKLSKLTELAKEKQIKTIYFEELASPKVAETLANEIGAKTEILNPLEGLTNKEKEKGMGYIEVMEQNLNNLKKAL